MVFGFVGLERGSINLIRKIFHRGVLHVLFSCFTRFSSATWIITVPQPVPQEQLPTRKHRLSSDLMAGKCNPAMRCNLRRWKGTETNRSEEKAFKKVYLGKLKFKKIFCLCTFIHSKVSKGRTREDYFKRQTGPPFLLINSTY